MPTSDTTTVAICVATFRRPESLCALLQGISRLAFEKTKKPDIEIMIVDNDKFASAKEVCSRHAGPWPLKYAVEPRLGITYARNRAVAEAMPADFVAFIDDDEVPSPLWLDELLWALSEFNADVVSGPVLPRYAPGAPEWVKSGGFFNARIAATGSIRRACPTNNALVRSDVFGKVPTFDDTFAVSGGEDTDFFLRVSHAGYRIVWSQEAVVIETISPDRANAAWIIRREFQTGNCWVFCESGLDNTPPSRAFRLAKSCAHILLGSASTLWRSVLFDWIGIVKSLQRISLGAGMLAAIAGHRFLAYRNAGASQSAPAVPISPKTMVGN